MDEAEAELRKLITQIHAGCSRLVKDAAGRFLPIAGNVAIFCQTAEDFKRFSTVAERITEPSDNPDQKYFHLREAIVVPSYEDIPGATYTWLYIRKPSPESPEAGDVDFILAQPEYVIFKQQVVEGHIPKAHVYDRSGWDMVELTDPARAAAPYISTAAMAEKVHVRF